MAFGSAQTRDEDARLVRGLGCYAGDRVEKGALWMHVVRADMAAGQIIAMDRAAAQDMPGVHLVLTGQDDTVRTMKDFTVRFTPPGTEPRLHPVRPLAVDRVRYMGEPVAIIVADTKARALDAAEVFAVDIEGEDAVTDARAADGPDVPQVWPDGNRVFTQERGDRVAYEAALAKAAHTVTARIEISCVTAVTLEPRNALAVPHGDRTTLYTGTQAPHRV